MKDPATTRGSKRSSRSAMAFISVAAIMAVAFACRQGEKDRAVSAPDQTAAGPVRVKPGIEVLFEKRMDLVRGKRVGLITNPTGIDGRLESTAELFARNAEIKLTALYGPEHGIRGNSQAGENVPFYFDDKYKVPVFSLYGQYLKPASGMLLNIDEYMRSNDTTASGKKIEGTMVQDIEVMVFDIQDVGTRVYTYIATMAYAMQACAEKGIPFVVLDRPNPINGLDMEGPILEYPQYSSFVGLFPIPVRHGMTVGELALLFNDKFLEKKAVLTVVPMEGWKREMWFDDTGLPWVIPSPNMPSLDTATVYPGQVYLEGTNLSEGRGTTRPFELFGAKGIDGYDLAKKLNALHLPGVIFRESWFTPTFSKFQGELCGGCQVHVTDRRAYRPFETSLRIIETVRDLVPGLFEFHADYFDKIAGTILVRKTLEKREALGPLFERFKSGIARFAELRKPYLLY